MNNILPTGKIIYQETQNGLIIKGISYNENELNQSAQIIADICYDSSGQVDFKDYIFSLSDTGFLPMDTTLPTVKDWQVGEGFAEAYLTAHFSCNFPWSNNRDLKNPNSSLTGADMVGFHQGEFAFGEVKTSTEQQYPPQVTSKKEDGLNAQLTKLCHNRDIQWLLIQYLFYRTKGTTKYQKACTAYLNNNSNFYVFGILVRDVVPQVNDWNHLKKHLKAHKMNRVSLLALYLPCNGGIKNLHVSVLSKGGKS